MPEQISVSVFLQEAWDDFNSPTTSTFAKEITRCRNTTAATEETLDIDRSILTKMKKSMKALYNTGLMHVANEEYIVENLYKLGTNANTRDNDQNIGDAFHKFSVVTRELSALMRCLMQNLNNIVLFPLDSFLKGELKGVKGDLKKPFDKAWKEYDTKFTKIEKEKKQLAKDVGMFRTEVSGAEIADEMEKERRMYQLQMCEYLIKVNEIKTKKGCDLLQHLVDFYHAQTIFFRDGIKTLEHYNTYIDELVGQLATVKQSQDEERRKLVELRDALKTTMSVYKEPLTPSSSVGYNIHPLQGEKIHGCEKGGHLLKKSEGRIKKVWQRRRVSIKDGFFYIGHSDSGKDPVRLNLLTCQVKLVPEDPGKKCFDLISSSTNRTYHFQGEDIKDMEEWISVLNNAKEQVLLKAFQDTSNSPAMNQSVRELTSSIIERIKRLPGNRVCCDCGAPDPQWLSTNLGVLICLECCGIHRELGVHISRTQSIIIDELGTSQLLLARMVANASFNDIMEATLDVSTKPLPTSNMDERRKFIRAKYEEHKYAYITCTDKEDLKMDLQQAIVSRDIHALIQVYAEGIDLLTNLPNMANEETALHLAISQEDGTSLHIVEFIIQNSNINKLEKVTRDGASLLHMCARLNRTECMKLLLRTKPDLTHQLDGSGQTALDISHSLDHHICVELIKSALAGRNDQFANVNVEWDLVPDDNYCDQIDYSDDDLDATPERKTRSRPASLVVLPSELQLQINSTARPVGDASDRLNVMPAPQPQAKPRKYVTFPSSKDSRFAVPNTAAPTMNHKNNAMHHMTSSVTIPTSTAIPHTDSPSQVVRTSMQAPPIPAKKKQAPCPPPKRDYGHTRNMSEPNDAFIQNHRRNTSEPPPRPSKPDMSHRNTFILPPGAKLVLPPPPAFPDSKPNLSRYSRSHSTTDAHTSLSDQTPTHQYRVCTTSNTKSNDSPTSPRGQPPPPPQLQPRASKKTAVVTSRKRCRALYDCEADNDDELTFFEGEIISVIEEEEDDWWDGEIEGHPERHGLFPVSFVQMLQPD